MSFQAYLDNIKAKTGKTPEDFKKQLEKEKLFTPALKATDLVNWLKDKYELGHGHSMAIWAVFKSKGWVTDTKKKL
jgi:L-rhamnose isomerase